ncbi:MAG: hypothetical protein KAR11_07865 [Phycisphaerae bacterium]|nr:hypothetical protein [Phycisphaerae bacterium]
MTDTNGKESLALVDQGAVQPVKPRSTKKAETPKEMVLCVLCGVILAGGGLIASMVFTVRKYQGSVSRFVWDAAWADFNNSATAPVRPDRPDQPPKNRKNNPISDPPMLFSRNCFPREFFLR